MRTERHTRPLAAISLLFALIQPALAADAAGDGNSRAISAGRSLIGQPGPAATLTTIDGQRIDLASIYGKQPVYLKFWATWCVPCREQMPGFERIYEKYGKRIAVIAVNAGLNETEAGVRAYRAEHGLHMPIVIDDGSLGRKLNLRVTPQHILIGTDGRIEYVGHQADKGLDDALEKAVSEKAGTRTLPLAPQVAGTKTLKVGDEVRGIVLTTIGGKRVSLAAGSPRALVFFSPWCESYLRDSRPGIASACRRVRLESERLAGQPGTEWLAISAPVWASDSELAAYAKANHTRIPLALDRTGEAFGAFGVRQFPSVVLIDARNRVAQILGPDDTGLAQALGKLKAQ